MTRIAITAILLGVASSAVATSCTIETKHVQTVNVPDGMCGHALVVLSNVDYQSISVGLVGFDGKVLSPSIVSSASASTGLSAAFSGDTVLPNSPTPDGFVLIDRTPAGVLSWVDPTTGKVTRQLSVVPGTNPHDYLQVSPTQAYVSRYDINPEAGQMQFDRGGDIIEIDPSKPSITSTIDLDGVIPGLPSGVLPHADRMLMVNGKVIVLVASYSKDYKVSGDSALIQIDPATNSVASVVKLENMLGCTGLALSPSQGTIAVACSGAFNGSSNPVLTDAGIAIVDTKTFTVSQVLSAAQIGNQPPGFSLAFSSEDTLLFPTFGSVDAGTLDHFASVQLPDGTMTSVATSQDAFDFGEVRCFPACGACFLTDANPAKPTVHRYVLDANGATSGEADVVVGGLEPRYLGAY